MRYLEIALAVLTIIIGILQIIPQYTSKPKEEHENLKILFKSTQNISKRIQIKIENYISKHDNPNELLFENVSFESYLNLLRDSYHEFLNNNLYSKIEDNNYSKSTIKSMTKSLETQINNLLEIENLVKLSEMRKNN